MVVDARIELVACQPVLSNWSPLSSQGLTVALVAIAEPACLNNVTRAETLRD
jgi:hypothetical protein